MDVLELIAENCDGGVVSRRRLLALGVEAREISRLRHAGVLTVVRPGWYAIAGADDDVVAAVAAGATLACVSALRFAADVWIPPGDRRSHRRWPPRHGKQRTHQGCRAHRTLAAPVRAVDPLPIALQCAANCLAPEYFVAVLDSVLRMAAPCSIDDLRGFFEGAPRRVSRLLDLLDPDAESGTESVVRYRLANAHIRVRSQMQIPDVGRVDLLVGDLLIIECDSDGFHSGAQRKEDNRRDRKSTIGRYVVLRIDYDDVMFDWDTVYSDVLDIIRTRRHRTRRSRSVVVEALPDDGAA